MEKSNTKATIRVIDQEQGYAIIKTAQGAYLVPLRELPQQFRDLASGCYSMEVSVKEAQ